MVILLLKKLTGGITNSLYIVTSDKVPARHRELPVVLRIYGVNTEKIIDRVKELKIQIESFHQGVGPKLWGVFKNGCVYAYLPGRDVELLEMNDPKISKMIAREVAKWHKLNMSGERVPVLWRTIYNWSSQIPRTVEDPAKNEVLQALNVDLLITEVAELEEKLKQYNSPVVFCHNDLLHRNLILSENGDAVFFIDFEYANFNFRGFDIANHFNEFAGFEVDYSLFPSRETQLTFLREYLQALGEEATPEKLEKLLAEVELFVLASHLYWGFWALIQSQNSEIDFDFFGYSKARFDQYYKVKQSIKPQ
eukprot:TRINITY_DN4097_c0_g1_i2.p1 TRINITY_DN4097_c0_g1~~TRINITY_DN4097_c0_g1_i2.p1  ORF type:complete len:308 (+),score=75.63 TRINITY_DN4097_c0_g1_i2:200-1123(+)